MYYIAIQRGKNLGKKNDSDKNRKNNEKNAIFWGGKCCRIAVKT